MRHFAQESSWEFRYLTQDNYTDYLSKESQELYKRLTSLAVYDLKPPQKVDIIRLLIIYENGGMWVDSSTIFHFNLSWIDNIEKESNIFEKAGRDV